MVGELFLVQLESDYVPYFMGLAAMQLALDDKEAARRSLLRLSVNQAMLQAVPTATGLPR